MNSKLYIILMMRGIKRSIRYQILFTLGLIVIGASIARAQEPLSNPTFEDLTNEKCTFIKRSEVPSDPLAPEPSSIICSQLTHKSGTVTFMVLPPNISQNPLDRHKVVLQAVLSSRAGQINQEEMTCRPGEWQNLEDGQEIFIRSCVMLDGDWPSVSLVMITGKYIVFADGLPVLLPVMASIAEYRLSQFKKVENETVETITIGLHDPVKLQNILNKAFLGPFPKVNSLEVDQFKTSMEAARLQQARKDYRSAETSLRIALAIQEKALGVESIGIGNTLLELALSVSNQGHTDEAESLFRRADPIIQKTNNPSIMPRFNIYMSYNAANAGKFVDALTYSRESSNLWRDILDAQESGLSEYRGDNHFHSVIRGELAHSLSMVAAMAYKTGDLVDAESSAKEALEILAEETTLPQWWRPELLVTMGQIYGALGRINEAETSFKGALIFQQRLFGETSPMAMTLLELGRVYFEQAMYDEAIKSFQFAIKIFDNQELARSHLNYDHLIPLVNTAEVIKKNQSERTVEMNQLIFHALQLLSSGVADQTIAKASLRMASDDPIVSDLMHQAQEAERKRDEARIELSHETAKPDEERAGAKESALLKEINNNEALRVKILNEINTRLPNYANMSSLRIYNLADFQKMLSSKEAIVLFEIGRKGSHAILITNSILSAQILEINQKKVTEAVRDLRTAFTPKADGRLPEFDLVDSYSLYKKLYSSLEPFLTNINHLILVQSGALASLPMSILVTKNPEKSKDYKSADWFLKHYSSSIVPSISAFISLRNRANTAKFKNIFLGIGNPAFVGSSGKEKKDAMSNLGQCREAGPVPAQFLRALTPLPDTETELRAIAKSLDVSETSLILGKKATEEAFRKAPYTDTKILYFATHGLLPGELSCQTEPGLALSPPLTPATSRNVDGLLEASEIAGLQIKADIVILSACNTAQSPTELGGEALAGLADSFFYAGARSVLASHWEVSSSATTNLMTTLFSLITNNPKITISQALEEAQTILSNYDETAHPFFWAAFTLLGDGGNLPTEKRSPPSDKKSTDRIKKGA